MVIETLDPAAHTSTLPTLAFVTLESVERRLYSARTAVLPPTRRESCSDNIKRSLQAGVIDGKLSRTLMALPGPPPGYWKRDGCNPDV